MVLLLLIIKSDEINLDRDDMRGTKEKKKNATTYYMR